MFLSKINIDRRRWDVIHDLDDRDRLHKKLLNLFPDFPGGPTNARQRHGVLFRAEGTFILMQSKIAPSTERLAGGYTLVTSKDVSSNYATIQLGRVYRFRLDANTSMQVPDDTPSEWIPEAKSSNVETLRRTKRIGCGNYKERSRWLDLASKRSGFETVNYTMDTQPVLKAKGTSLEITRFEGTLKVTNLDIFQKALFEGIGQGKAYGLGLLSLRNA